MKIALSPELVVESNGRAFFLTPGTTLQGRYRIVRRLGKGGMGAVYEAIDQRLDTTVALKETFSADVCLRRQFAQEAHLLALLHHPALPRVSDYFSEGDRAFLVMQFIEGADLAEIIATQPGPFPRQQVIAWADQLLDALIYLHTSERQVVHRDIKPHNLKLTSTGQIALLDFGLAKASSSDLSGTNSSTSIFGYTRRYSPLEQIQDRGTNPQSDIYALGATLYHLLTGIKPPDALTRATALAESKPDPLRPADEIYHAVGPEIAAILRLAMAVNPEDRYQTASDFREALRRLGRSSGPKAKSISPEFDSTVNPATIKHELAVPVDPFDHYSILKPDETAWLVRKSSSRLRTTVAAMVVMLAVSFGICFGDARWIDSAKSWLNYTRVSSETKDQSVVAASHQEKSDKPRAAAASSANVRVPQVGSADALRKNEKSKRRISRTENPRPRFPKVKPPPISIAP